jgi:hypothetical protein
VLKATTVPAMFAGLGMTPAYSRPRMSDDNAVVKSLIRAAK